MDAVLLKEVCGSLSSREVLEMLMFHIRRHYRSASPGSSRSLFQMCEFRVQILLGVGLMDSTYFLK